MFNDMFKDITGVAMAIVGVAILFTLVNPRNKTSDVIRAASTGFSQSLSAAMGAQVSGSGTYGGM